jgi:nucleoid-associated protein YgaU
MGQLEKYGLYVLCLVIFLILGVTIWGGGEVAAGKSPAVAINAPGGTTGARSSDGGSSTAPRSRSLDLLLPVASAPQEPRTGGGERPSTAGSQQAPEQPPKPATADPATELYTVQDGDSFESIAVARLGSRAAWPEIEKLNPGVDPRRLRPGQQLKLPSAAALAASSRAKAARGNAPAPEVGGGGRSYTVKKGDTIEGIALNVLGSRARRDELLALNPSAQKVIRPGDVLKLPAK